MAGIGSTGKPQDTIVSVTPLRVDRDTRTFKEAASFSRLGYRSVVVEGHASDLEPSDVPFELMSAEGPGATTVGPHVHASQQRSLLRRGASRPLRVPAEVAVYYARSRAMAARIPPADLYWLHSYDQAAAVLLAARRNGTPIVYDAHDFYPEIIEGGEGTRPEKAALRAFLRRMERRAAHRAAATVTVSDGVAELFVQDGRSRPLVIRNCAELRIAPRGVTSVRDVVGVGPEDFLVVMPGNHKPGTRAVDEAIAALRQLPPSTHLAFVGQGYDSFDRQAGSSSARVHFLPAVPALEVPSFIASADAAIVLYVPTLDDIEHALPNGLFSAIAAGLPLLYPRLAEIRRIAAEYDLGLVIDPRDPASIAAGVRALAESPEAIARYRANAERARTVLNWEREEETLAEIVRSVLARRPRQTVEAAT